MKRLISILAALVILLAVPGAAAADSPDWTLVTIPGPGGGSPVFFDTNSYLASDITLDIKGNLYVMSGSRIIRFTPEGKVDTAWGKNGIIYDPVIEELNCEQLSITADSRGYVYAHCRICEDGSPTFIKRYAPDGEADTSWYGDGIMGGKLVGEELVSDEAETEKIGIINQDEIAVDSRNNLYVLYDRRVYKFNPDGTKDKKWRKVKMKQPKYEYDEGGDGVWFSNKIALDQADNVYLFNGYNRYVSKYSRTGRSLKSEKCKLYYLFKEEDFSEYLINDVSFDAKGRIYHVNPDGASISRYSSKFKRDKLWCEGAFTVGKQSEPVQTIDNFELDAAGNIYILDKLKGVVCRYKNDGTLDKAWGTNGSIGSVNSSGQAMFSVTDIVSDIDGSMYALSDCLNDEDAIITKIGSDFEPDRLWAVETYGSIRGYKTSALNSLAAYNGLVYTETGVSDTGEQDYGVLRLTKFGLKDSVWGISLRVPVWDIKTDSKGNIFVAGGEITKYLPDGSADESWGLKGSIKGADFLGETAVDSEGYLYVSSRGNNTITRYTPGGQLDKSWGREGTAGIPVDGEEGTEYDTYCIALDTAGNLYLSDYANNRILRYNSRGQIDSTWCSGGGWRSSDDISDDLMPMIHPTHMMIREGRLYALWNNRLYVMSDSIAQVGVKLTQAEQQSEPETKEAVSAAEPLSVWEWAVCIGGLLFCAGAVLAVFLILRNKGRRSVYMSKVKSIKIAKRQ